MMAPMEGIARLQKRIAHSQGAPGLYICKSKHRLGGGGREGRSQSLDLGMQPKKAIKNGSHCLGEYMRAGGGGGGGA